MDLRDAVDAQLAFLRMELRPTVFCPAELIRKGVQRTINSSVKIPLFVQQLPTRALQWSTRAASDAALQRPW